MLRTVAFDRVIRQRQISVGICCIQERLGEGRDRQCGKHVRTLEVTAGLLRLQVNQENNPDNGAVRNVTVE